MEPIKLLLSKAHAEFRRLRSGELGDNLRSQGIIYQIVWGLESYHLKTVAQELQPEIEAAATEAGIETSELQATYASALWEEDVRESKMLATRLYPIDKMTPELAGKWASAIRYTELADQLCMNLLSRTEFAETLVRDWIQPGHTDLQKYMALQIALRRDWTIPEAKGISEDETLPRWLRATALKLVQ